MFSGVPEYRKNISRISFNSRNLMETPILEKGSLRWRGNLASKSTTKKLLDTLTLGDTGHVRRWDNLRISNFTSSRLKKILYFNDFDRTLDFTFGEGMKPFERDKCPVVNCFVTSNRALVRPEEADAIIWNVRSQFNNGVLPQKISAHTRMVYFAMESPNHVYLDMKKYRNIFNYTFSYSQHSDIYNPYGFFVHRKTPLTSRPGNYALGKTKLAVWFASHCGTIGNREGVVNNLLQYIDIDIFGKCGLNVYQKDDDQNPDHILKMVEKKYKFYFAFENSLCKDYITEKFFMVARFNIIPVVYGLGPYHQVAPPHSYINVMDFETAKDLADYLVYLNNNDTAYNEYFWWKPKYESLCYYRRHKPADYNQISWCQLCQKLHSDLVPKTYEQVDTFHSRENHCVSGSHALLIQYKYRVKYVPFLVISLIFINISILTFVYSHIFKYFLLNLLKLIGK